MESHKAGFPPFPLLLEIPAGFPYSHRFDDGFHLSNNNARGLYRMSQVHSVTLVPVHSVRQTTPQGWGTRLDPLRGTGVCLAQGSFAQKTDCVTDYSRPVHSF